VRIFSGIQPTGRKHLGNYIGAITQYVAGQDRGDPAIYCIVDLHAVTVPYEPQELRERVYDTAALLMAAGLDPDRCVLFRQGDVEEHTELCWLLASVTAYGDLQRMHQFKEKSAGQRELVSAGLFLYPVLQAADVLAYRAHEVPVGEDQRQHIELMRDIAQRFNARFGEVLVVPEGRVVAVLGPNATHDAYVAMYKQLGLDQPLWKQYASYMGNLLRGDLGPSFKHANRSVNELIAAALPVSLELGGIALCVALLVGIPLGIAAAVRQNTWIDYLASTTAMAGICLPTFVMGPLLVLVFALHFEQFNASGWDFARDRVLPALTLGLVYAGYIARLTRGGMLEVLNQDFIRTARAKGASETRVVFRHALRGGLLPVVSFLGPAIAGILTGSFVIETIFNIPGLGRHFVTSVFNRDATLTIGTALFYAVLVVALNLAADIAQAMLNPKQRAN